MQDRYSTIGPISTYLHPSSKGTELHELVTWLKQQKNDYPLYISGNFNQADRAFSDLWIDLLIHARVTDIQPNGHSALDRIFCLRPPLRFTSFWSFCGVWLLIYVAFSLAVWRGSFSFCFVSAFSPGGAVEPRRAMDQAALQ